MSTVVSTMTDKRSEQWGKAMGLIHNLEASAHTLGLMRENPDKFRASQDDIKEQRESVMGFKRRLMDLVTEMDKLAHPEPREFKHSSDVRVYTISLPKSPKETANDLVEKMQRRIDRTIFDAAFGSVNNDTPV